MDTIGRIRDLAFFSIGRACLFGVLAIFTTMFGMITWPLYAFRLGAIGATMTGAILLLKAVRAPTRNYKQTEVWILLGRQIDWPEGDRQRLIGAILNETYIQFATWAAAFAALFWLIALGLWLVPSPAI
ncbi:MAG: hypothetical protein JNL66_03450 [Alphaproteobacteria bacterium]|nr:hypothetical protein [Alphaproteobacteria bacterium]